MWQIAWHKKHDTKKLHKKYDTNIMTQISWHKYHDTNIMTQKLWHKKFDTNSKTQKYDKKRCKKECQISMTKKVWQERM